MWLYNVQLCPHNATAAPHLVFGRCPTIFGCSLNIAWHYFHLGSIQVHTLPISEHLDGPIVKIRYSRWGHPKQNFRQAHVPGGHLRGLLGPKLVPKGHLKTIPMPAGGGKGKQRASAAGNGKEQARSAAALLAAVAHGTVPARAAATGTGSSSKKTARPSGYGVAELSDDEAQVSRHDDAAQPAAEEPARHLVSSARRRSPQDISCRAPDAGAGGRSSCRAR